MNTDDENMQKMEQLDSYFMNQMALLSEMPEGYTPHMIAAIMQKIAMQVYRTTLSDDDYQKFMDYVYENRNRIQKFNFEGMDRQLN